MKLRFMFDYCVDSCLWSCDQESVEKYGVGPVDLEKLPLSLELRRTLYALCDKYDSSLDWRFPQNGNVWTKEECEIFLEQARTAYENAVCELGMEVEVGWENKDIIEL